MEKEEYKFIGDEGGLIDEQTAEDLKGNYKKSFAPGEPNVIAHFYGKDKIQQLLDTRESVGIRIYHGLDKDGNQELVLYAVRSDGKDIVPEAIILDTSKRCPPYCR